MAKSKRSWTDYPPEYVNVFKAVAVAPLPAICKGPYTEGEAHTFRRNFYRFREALQMSSDLQYNSYPARLYRMLQILSVKVEPSSNTSEYNVIFDLDPIVMQADRIDPAAAQARQLAKAQFVAAQRLPQISEPIFTDEEMQERLKEIEHGDGK